MLKTALTESLGITHPIFQGGMAWVATGELVVAVSEAGALGILGAGNAPIEWVREQLEYVQNGTSGPYGVNVPLFSPYVAEVVALCIEKKVPVLTTGAGNPTPFIESLKKAGVIVIPVVSSAGARGRRCGDRRGPRIGWTYRHREHPRACPSGRGRRGYPCDRGRRLWRWPGAGGCLIAGRRGYPDGNALYLHRRMHRPFELQAGHRTRERTLDDGHGRLNRASGALPAQPHGARPASARSHGRRRRAWLPDGRPGRWLGP